MMHTSTLYAVLIALLIALVVTLGALADQGRAHTAEFTPGTYCAGSPTGPQVYAPGRIYQGEALIIWHDTGRTHYLPIEQLEACTP